MPLVVAVAALLLIAAEDSALACPACAGGAGGSPAWVIALLLGLPLVAACVAALIIRRLLARAPSP
jgi:hypothetical protein